MELDLLGLQPIARYSICFELGSAGGNSLCQKVKTTLIIREEGISAVCL